MPGPGIARPPRPRTARLFIRNALLLGFHEQAVRARWRLPAADRDDQRLAGPETLEQGPWLMMDAIYRWGLAPWDLVLTFVPAAGSGSPG